MPQRKLVPTLGSFGWLAVLACACEHGDIILGTSGGAAAPTFEAVDAGAKRAMPAAGSGARSSGQMQQDAMVRDPEPAAAEPVDAGLLSNVRAAKRTSAGCSKAPEPVQTSVQIAGTRAHFLLDLPSGYHSARAYPLVLAFRGMSTTAEAFRDQLDLATVTAEDAIRVYANPVGDGTVWEFQRDMPLVDALLVELTDAYCVDLDRVFALGDGAGALFVNLVGCVRADKVRGIALLSSAPPPPGPCAYNTAVWMLQQVDGEPMLLNAGLGNRDFWVGRNACQLNMSEPLTTTSCVDYLGCAPQFPVRYCQQEGDELPTFAVPGAWAFFSAL